MRIGLSLPTMLPDVDGPTTLAWCRRVEADGYDTIGFGERIAYPNLEMFSVLSAAAAVTERVRIASTIVVLPMHSAAWVAKQTATLDVLSGGRVTLGVGVGGRNEDYRALGRDFSRRFDRLDRQVEEIRQLWAGRRPAPDLEPVGPSPVQAHIPILSGAMGPRSVARSARWADGIAGFEMDPSDRALAEGRERMDRAWADAGREAPPYRMTSFWFALGPDGPDRLRAYARRYLGVFGAELADALADGCTVSSPAALRGAVEAMVELGYDEVQLVPTTADLTELDRLAEALGGLRGRSPR
jgi:alkanesulfonate monooxygenase SsuD/methylene tetrahydromethanopterin reductase-like flavin-dependent oxidoreductase (luciferase family)